LELIRDDVRVASGDTPQAARASSGLSAAAGFANEEPGTGEQRGQEEQERHGRAGDNEQHAGSEDGTLDLYEGASKGGTRERLTSEAPRTAPQPPPAPRMPSPAPRTTPTLTPAQPAPAREIIREYRGQKKMRLPVFKGLDGTMPISTWLRAVQTEARRQEQTLGLHWGSDEVYFEMASHFRARRYAGTATSSTASGRRRTRAWPDYCERDTGSNARIRRWSVA
jgi:hypothetical protein